MYFSVSYSHKMHVLSSNKYSNTHDKVEIVQESAACIFVYCFVPTNQISHFV